MLPTVRSIALVLHHSDFMKSFGLILSKLLWENVVPFIELNWRLMPSSVTVSNDKILVSYMLYISWSWDNRKYPDSQIGLNLVPVHCMTPSVPVGGMFHLQVQTSFGGSGFLCLQFSHTHFIAHWLSDLIGSFFVCSSRLLNQCKWNSWKWRRRVKTRQKNCKVRVPQ